MSEVERALREALKSAIDDDTVTARYWALHHYARAYLAEQQRVAAELECSKTALRSASGRIDEIGNDIMGVLEKHRLHDCNTED